MNIRTQLLKVHSKPNTNLIVEFIGGNKARLEELMACFFSLEYRVSQRAAMVVSAVFDQTPELMSPYIEQLILNLEKPNQHIAIKRNTIRILQFAAIPEQLTSALFDHCLNNLIRVEEPTAVKAFSMTVLLNTCKQYPELAQEVVPVLELELERTESKGVLNRAKKVISLLNKLK